MLSICKILLEVNNNQYYTLKMVKQIPLNIFKKAAKKCKEYNNYQEYLLWANSYIPNWFKDDPKFKSKMFLFDWGNGDYCLYDIISKKILDYNHETDKFEKTQWN
jgi:hypothetical protein